MPRRSRRRPCPAWPRDAADTGYPDKSFDHVVSINNLLFWDALPAGFWELRRLLRPGGTIVVAFHSRCSPVRHERRIGLPEEDAERARDSMAAIVGEVERQDLERLMAFTAVR
ncbi:MAG: class I SAM-dependent methyltransferase [Streptosporangiaceae bacterium]